MREEYQPPRLRAAPFVLASAVAAIVVLWAPFVSPILGWIQSTFPGQFTLIVGASVGAAVAAATIAALLRIRERRGLRYGTIAAAVVFGAAYAIAFRTGEPGVDVVERFHFVEYGLVTLLFYFAWRRLGDPSVFLLPAIAALIVGTFDELVQWFIPVRVGELHDIFLNGAAIAAGLLFSAGVEPPAPFQTRFHRASFARLGQLTAALVVTLAAFVAAVHLGHEIHDTEVGTFRSRYTAPQLLGFARDRAEAWRGQTIAAPPVLSREDQYFSEALWHVQRRNVKVEEKDLARAWGENRILEKYFAPVLDTPSYVSASGFRWPPEQRAGAAAHAPPEDAGYVSDAEVYRLYLWPEWMFWTLTALIVAALLAAGRRRGCSL